MEGNGRQPCGELLRINNLTTRTGRCGISCYSDLLFASAAEEMLDVATVPLPRCSSNPLVYARAGLDSGMGARLISVQYALGVFGKLLNVPKLRGINYFPLIWLFLMLHRMLGKKVVYTVHELCPAHPWEKACLPLLKMSGDAFFVLSDRVGKDLERSGIDRAKIIRCPFPLRAAKKLPKAECKEALGIGRDRQVILLFGFVSPSKGFDLVLEALPSMPESTLVVIAGSPRTEEDRAYRERLGKAAAAMPGRVVFLGYVDDRSIPLVLGSADLAIEPYRSIHNSGVLSDLMSYGLPVLASDLEYFSGIAGEFGCIETFRAGDAGDLARRMERLMRDGRRRSALAASTARYRAEAEKALPVAAAQFRRMIGISARSVRGRPRRAAPRSACAEGRAGLSGRQPWSSPS